jgi:LuxR family transcriptional regulator
MQLLVRESLSVLTRLEDDMVMAPEMRFSKREKEILKWTAEEDLFRDSHHSVDF